MVFSDSDVYKWLEALAWETAARAVRPSSRRLASETTELVAAAQQPDGYLNSYWQVSTAASAGATSRWDTSSTALVT